MKTNDLVDEIVRLEWEAFDKVQNEGGRADCQEDWNTFQIMRKSQYLTWDEDMLIQFKNDFILANNRGWNMITEKYARMMESTAKEQYDALKDKLPVISDEKKRIMEEIIAIQVRWMEEFSGRYPKLAGNARSIHTAEDNAFNTSYETYLRGELGTYSDEMLDKYGRFVAKLLSEQKNLSELTMRNTVLLYGYHSLADAEERLS